MSLLYALTSGYVTLFSGIRHLISGSVYLFSGIGHLISGSVYLFSGNSVYFTGGSTKQPQQTQQRKRNVAQVDARQPQQRMCTNTSTR